MSSKICGLKLCCDYIKLLVSKCVNRILYFTQEDISLYRRTYSRHEHTSLHSPCCSNIFNPFSATVQRPSLDK